MAKSFKVFLMILGLAVFTLPKQMAFAQNVEKCCKLKSVKENCCKEKETKPCHKENPSKKSENKSCGNDCASCSSCSMSMVFQTISPEVYTDSSKKNDSPENEFQIRNFIFFIQFSQHLAAAKNSLIY